MPQFEVFQDINSQEYTNFVPIPEYHDYYEEFPTVYWENTYEDPAEEERKRERDSSSDSSSGSGTSVSSSATVLGRAGRSLRTSGRSGGRGGRSGGGSSGASSPSAFASVSATSIIAATFVALVAVSAFVLPTIDNAEMTADLDVDYGGDTLTYMVSLTNASANAKYFVVVMEGATVVYEKEIIDGYQTGIVQGLDGTKEHRVEIRTGMIPLYVVDSATIPAQDTSFEPVEVNSLTASLNTIQYDVTLKAGSGNVTMGIYAAEGEPAVFTNVLTEGANTGTVTDLLYGHEYIVKFFDESKTHVIKAVTTYKMDSDIAITGVTGLTYLSVEKALVTKTGNDEQMIQYSIDGGANWITTIPEFTNAGEYTVRYKADESNSYKALAEGSVVVTVAKVDSAITAPTAITGLVYDGANHALVNAGSSDDGTVKYSLSVDGSFVSEIPEVANAGAYNVYFMVEGDENHNNLDPSEDNKVPVILAKADAAVTLAPEIVTGLEYAGDDLELIIAGTATGGTMQYSLTPGSDYSSAIPVGVSVGSYNVYYKVVGDENHNDVAETGPLAVTIAKATIAWPTIESKVYTGSAQTASVPVSERYEVTVNEGGTNAGDYPVTLTLIDSDNYKWADVDTAAKTVDDAFVIDKANATITAAPTARSLGNNTMDQVLVNGGTATGGTMKYSLSLNGEYTVDIPTGNATDDYTVYYMVEGDANHNDVSPAGENAVVVSIVDIVITYNVSRVGESDTARAILTFNIDDLTGYSLVFYSYDYSYTQWDTLSQTPPPDYDITITGNKMDASYYYLGTGEGLFKFDIKYGDTLVLTSDEYHVDALP